MTRQSRARWLAFATAALVVLLAAAFAWLRNLAPAGRPEPASAEIGADRELLEGRVAFERMGCSGCHSVEGRGNPTLPLDGVGSRLDSRQLREAAFALGEAGIRLPAAVAARKRGHETDADAATVIDYLQKSR